MVKRRTGSGLEKSTPVITRPTTAPPTAKGSRKGMPVILEAMKPIKPPATVGAMTAAEPLPALSKPYTKPSATPAVAYC